MMKNFINKFKEYIENQNQFRKNLQVYNRKRSDYIARLDKEFLDHGIATIPCKVSDIDDIISSYSVAGYESLNSEFVEYVNASADIIPEKYPIVLSIVGKRFTADEQEIIRNTIDYELAYALGFVERDINQFFKMILLFIIGTILTGQMIAQFDWLPAVHIEMLYIFYWFFAYTLVEYIFLERSELKKQKIKAARLACVKVVFSDKYDDSDYSDSEVQEILDELSEA